MGCCWGSAERYQKYVSKSIDFDGKPPNIPEMSDDGYKQYKKLKTKKKSVSFV